MPASIEYLVLIDSTGKKHLVNENQIVQMYDADYNNRLVIELSNGQTILVEKDEQIG